MLRQVGVRDIAELEDLWPEVMLMLAIANVGCYSALDLRGKGGVTQFYSFPHGCVKLNKKSLL